MAKTVCKILGVVFLFVGMVGFVSPNLLGAQLNAAHNLVHLVSGADAHYFGFAGSLSAAKTFCLVFGLVYLGLGVLGLLLGAPPDRMFMLGPLHFGQADHGIHILLGVIFVAGGFLTKNP